MNSNNNNNTYTDVVNIEKDMTETVKKTMNELNMASFIKRPFVMSSSTQPLYNPKTSTPVNYGSHDTFGGTISNSEFETNHPCDTHYWMRKIVSDWAFDKTCFVSDKARDKRKEYYDTNGDIRKNKRRKVKVSA